jgi:hypothetical protein
MAIKITISKQMVACNKKKTALVCFFSEKYHTRAFLGQEKHSCDIFTPKCTLVQLSYCIAMPCMN